MVENIDINAVVKRFSEDFDVLIDERQDIREKTAKLKARADEIDRKLQGIQTALQGLTLYNNAQDAPTELTKRTTISLSEVMKKMASVSIGELAIPGADVRKTLSECCRDILRQKQDWMSPVQVREALLAAGFDFSNYTSNPLSSIHTTLKRLVPEELLTETRPDGQVYRWNTVELSGMKPEAISQIPLQDLQREATERDPRKNYFSPKKGAGAMTPPPKPPSGRKIRPI
jgi:hypothetical protein